MEPELEIRCLKRDFGLVASIKDSCIEEYKALIQKECNRSVECVVTINEDKPLDDFDQNWYISIFLLLASAASA
jgi:hypothetical protein